jgi:hypothetical protein
MCRSLKRVAGAAGADADGAGVTCGGASVRRGDSVREDVIARLRR